MKTITIDAETGLIVETDDGLEPESIPIELSWRELRFQRNALLQQTDWMGCSDVTMSDAWKTYRQALRDLPATTSDPANPTYPTKPE